MQTFDLFTSRSRDYWRAYLPSEGLSGPPILVDMMHFNLEYVASGLAAAAALRTATGRPLVGLIGRAGVIDAIAPPLDLDAITRLAEAFGVERLIDVHAEIQAAPPAAEWLNPLRAIAYAGPEGDGFSAADIDTVKGFTDPDGFPIGRFIMDTTLRAGLTPNLRYGPVYVHWLEYVGRARAWARGLLDADAFTAVTMGHTDYCPHGFIAEYAVHRGVPALLWTPTDRSAYLLPRLEPGQSLTAACREAVRQAFETHLATVEDAEESEALVRLIADSSLSPGRTGLAAQIAADTPVEVKALTLGPAFFPRDPRPLVCLFAHTYSDVPCQDEALFRDHSEWIEQTLIFAARDESFNVLVKVHPQDAAYDTTGLTAELEARFAGFKNVAFCHRHVTYEALARDCSLGVTVRGTPGFLMPALGLRMLLAGRSIYSDAGVAPVATGIEDYFEQIRRGVDAPPMTDAEKARARAFAAFHLLTGSPRTGLTPLLQADGRDSPFFAWAAETLRTWTPEDCELTEALGELWNPETGRLEADAALRLGGRARRRGKTLDGKTAAGPSGGNGGWGGWLSKGRRA